MITLLFKSFIFTILVPGMVAVMAPLHIINGLMVDTGWQFIFGSLLLLAGLVIYCVCVWGFVTTGHGTPAPVNPPKCLVVKGLYGYSRNPMYLAVLIVILGWTFLYDSLPMLVYWVFLLISFQLLVMFYEEPELQKEFGSEYIAYKATVKRWLPKI
jgi:protein-S-isoprenylcysteine O-methyltransferase Ste14